MFKNTLGLCFLLAWQLSAQVYAAEKSPLAKFAGEWATKPELCGHTPKLEADFPLKISKDGKKVGQYEDSCAVAKVSEKTQGTLIVRFACESEGEPYLNTEIYKFKGKTLEVVPEGENKGRIFQQCSTVAKGKPAKTSTGLKGMVLEEHCRMDWCSFFKFGDVKAKQKTATGELITLQYQSASVNAPPIEGQDDQYANVKTPSFESVPFTKLVIHCSKQRPFSAVETRDKKWLVQLFNFPDDQLPTYRATSVAFYMAVCHGQARGNHDARVLTKQMVKLGYGNQWSGDRDQLEFESIDEVRAFAAL